MRRQDDGSTTLNILNPDNTGYVDDRSRVVDLGTLTGKIQNGVGNIAGFREDKRNKVTPGTNNCEDMPYITLSEAIHFVDNLL